ncbi:MAG: hypothetical protein ACYDAI_02550 [Trichloromonadaceae bacterium]
MEKRITVRLSSADFAALQAEAGANGATAADVLRAAWRRSREAADLAALEDRLAGRIAAVPAATVAALAAARRGQ